MKPQSVYLLFFVFILSYPLLIFARTEVKSETKRVFFQKNENLKVLIQTPKGFTDTLVLFPGYLGKIKIRKNKIKNLKQNFLIRNLPYIHKIKLATVFINVPKRLWVKDNSFRKTMLHARHIERVVKYLKEIGHKNIWLVGNSQGAISAANAISKKPMNLVKGVVFISAVTQYHRFETSLLDYDFKEIKKSVLLVHHKKDRCLSSPFKNIQKWYNEHKGNKNIKLLTFDGGVNTRGSDCSGYGYHGFFKIEESVINKINDHLKLMRDNSL